VSLNPTLAGGKVGENQNAKDCENRRKLVKDETRYCYIDDESQRVPSATNRQSAIWAETAYNHFPIFTPDMKEATGCGPRVRRKDAVDFWQSLSTRLIMGLTCEKHQSASFRSWETKGGKALHIGGP
jgi:hypothetical protein